MEGKEIYPVSETHFDFSGAIVTFNCDPYMVENEETEKECMEFMERPGVELKEITPGCADFDNICDLLDLDLETMHVDRVYMAWTSNGEQMCFLLDKDWSFK